QKCREGFMLVLSRKTGERIVIGDGIEVVILDIRYGHVRLGFIAPHEVRIHRQEVAQRIEQEEARKSAQQGRAGVLITGGQADAEDALPHLSNAEAATA
ncbi:MAG TPA: carbon storage regulator CsrA, partial [Nitrospiraceae bacterium]|nr:carbon storage regulator CsrA [Nitrospiraceae bacterium]